MAAAPSRIIAQSECLDYLTAIQRPVIVLQARYRAQGPLTEKVGRVCPGTTPWPSAYRTHSLCRTKPAQIYKKAGNVRAVQLLLGARSFARRPARVRT
jgi:hypothetical protein